MTTKTEKVIAILFGIVFCILIIIALFFKLPAESALSFFKGGLRFFAISIATAVLIIIPILIVKAVKKAKKKSQELLEGPNPEYYAIAEQEITDNVYDKGLWSKALVNADGNESKRKSEYIKLRVKQLHKEKSK